MKLYGTFIALSDKDTIIRDIDDLNRRYGQKCVADNKQGHSMLKAYCHGLIALVDKYFAVDLRSVKRCRMSIEKYLHKDNPELPAVHLLDVYDTALGLRNIVANSIPLKDFPTCKHLNELSLEDAVSVANDLNRNVLTEVMISASLLGKKVGEAITISDIRVFYEEKIATLQSEIASDGGIPSETEIYLLDKFNAELAYCHKAILKTGIGMTKEIAGLIKTADEHISKFEERAMGEGHQVCVWK